MDEKNFITKKTKNESDVISFYDEYADSWDDRFGKSESTEKFLEHRWDSFVDMFSKNEAFGDALELGVGTGVYIKRASEKFKSILAIDGSQRMLDNLNRKIKENNINNVTTLKSDVTNMENVPSESFDYVYFFGLIEHIVDIESFVSEIYRVLREGGVVIGITPNAESPWYRLRHLVRGTGKHCATDTYYSIGQIDNIFKNKCFVFEKVKYWGAVPAGLRNRMIIKVLSIIESFVEKTPLARYLGGVTFRFKKC